MYSSAHNVHRLIYLAIATLALVASYFDIGLSTTATIGVLVVCVALLGIPHGALDPLLAYASGIARSPKQFARFLGLYIALAGSVVLIWWLVPTVTLAAFLLLSIWHFRSDWRHELKEWQALSAAAAIVCAPALFHPAVVQDVFFALSLGNSTRWLVTALQVASVISLTTLALTIVVVIKKRPRIAIELLSLPVLSAALSPLLFFVIYFCGLHSPRHIIAALQLAQSRWPTVALVGATTTCLTIAIAAAAFKFLPATESAQRLLVIVFIGLAALTVPHMLLIERSFDRR